MAPAASHPCDRPMIGDLGEIDLAVFARRSSKAHFEAVIAGRPHIAQEIGHRGVAAGYPRSFSSRSIRAQGRPEWAFTAADFSSGTIHDDFVQSATVLRDSRLLENLTRRAAVGRRRDSAVTKLFGTTEIALTRANSCSRLALRLP